MSRNLIIGIVAILVLGGGVLLLLQKTTTLPVAQTQPTTTNASGATQGQPKAIVTQTKPSTPTPRPATLAPQILAIQMSTRIAASGAAFKPVTIFSPTTPTIYAVLSLKNAVQRTQISYIRYYEGKYVDSKVSHPSVDGAKYFHFAWTLNAGKTRKTGNYMLIFYIDGKKAQVVNYSVH